MKIGCFTQNGACAHTQIQVWLLAFWCRFAVHVQYGITSPIHVEGIIGGVQGCIAPPKFPNLQKSPPKLLFAPKASLKNWEFYVFLDKEIA